MDLRVEAMDLRVEAMDLRVEAVDLRVGAMDLSVKMRCDPIAILRLLELRSYCDPTLRSYLRSQV